MFSQMRRTTVADRGLVVDYNRPFLAIYLNDPMVTSEAHRRTDICVPVIPLSMPRASNDMSDTETRIADRPGHWLSA
jgi:DNA gyrase inhibitor GyrI